jgi:hypothetical protein
MTDMINMNKIEENVFILDLDLLNKDKIEVNDKESDDESIESKKYLQFKKKSFFRKNKKLVLF